MPATRARLNAFALIIALLGALLVAPATPVAAGPGDPVNPSAVGFPMDADIPRPFGGFPDFYHWSVEFLLDLPGFDGTDPRLMDDDALEALGSRRRYHVGQVEHVLVAWRLSSARKDLERQLAKLDKQGLPAAQLAKERADLIEDRWVAYLRAYVTIHDNRFRGKAFELTILRMLGFSPADARIIYDKFYKKLPGQSTKRRPDLVSSVLKLIAEIKSGAVTDPQQIVDLLQIASDVNAKALYLFLARKIDDPDFWEDLRILIEKANAARGERGEAPLPPLEARVVPLKPVGVDIRLMPAGQTFATTPEPTPAAIAAHKAAVAAAAASAPAAQPGGAPAGGPPAAQRGGAPAGGPASGPATGDPGGQPAKPTTPTGGPRGGGPAVAAGALSAAGQVAAAGAGQQLVAASPASAAEARQQAAVAAEEAVAEGYQDADQANMTQPQLGGVDFATLELRYVSDTYDGGVGAGLRYAYQVDPAPGQKVSFGGRQAARLAAESFFTWLALRPSSFTVNLNPDEPNRIMDADFGRTEAGRVLLDADFQLKKTVAKLIHPDSGTGKRFWPELEGETPCLSTRQWIVPRPAVVRERGSELFILDAPLEVKMETEYLKTKGKGSEGCPGHSTKETKHNETVYRVVVLPELQKAVNQAPEYADLRRVYASRVAAEWYRERSRKKPTAYRDLIDSGDVSAWPVRGSWTPRDTWKRFVKSYVDGEFNIKRTTTEGNITTTRFYVYGGVDFSAVPERAISAADFTSKRPAMDASVNAAMAGPVAEAGGGPTWLGGWSSERPDYAAIPPPASPLGRPVFWAATAAPVLLWMIVAGLLLARLRRRAAR